MAEKSRHLGTWWCACGRTEPRPRLTAEEESRLEWWSANGNPGGMCGCPVTHTRMGRGPKEHTEECEARIAEMEALREEWDIDGLVARSNEGSRRPCPSCGSRMIQSRAPGARFPN